MEEIFSSPKDDFVQSNGQYSAKNDDEEENINALCCRLSDLKKLNDTMPIIELKQPIKEEPITHVEGECSYVYKKNSKWHKKGDVCCCAVATNPDFKEGINYCTSHQPKEGTPSNKCGYKYIKNGKEVICNNNVPEGEEEYCDSCFEQIYAEKYGEDETIIVKKKPTCVRILSKGKRKGKICGKNCVKNKKYCKSCIKTEDFQESMINVKKYNTNSEQIEQEDDLIKTGEENTESSLTKDIDDAEDNISIIDDDTIHINTLEPLDISKLHKLYTDIKGVEKLPLSAPLQYIIELLATKKKCNLSEMAQVLIWYCNQNFRYRSEEKYYSYFVTEVGKWLEIPVKNTIPVQNLKRSLCLDAIKILENLLNQSIKDKVLIENLKEKILEQSYEVDKRTFEYFIFYLSFDAVPERTEKEENFIQFLEDRVIIINDKKNAITTTDFMENYNEWCETKQLPIFTSDVHFGRLLSKINSGNNRWRTFNNGLKKHLVNFK